MHSPGTHVGFRSVRAAVDRAGQRRRALVDAEYAVGQCHAAGLFGALPCALSQAPRRLGVRPSGKDRNASQVPFSVFVRRHHCRLCGCIFCHECSRFTAQVRMLALSRTSRLHLARRAYAKWERALR